MANNLSVSVTADTTQLREGLAQATSSVREFVNDAGRVTGGLNSATNAARDSAAAFNSASLNAAAVAQNIAAIGAEAASGNFAALPSQVMAARDGMVAASAAAVGLGAALGAAAIAASRLIDYMYRLRDAREAVNAARVSFTPGIGEAEAESLRKQLVEMEGVSTEMSGTLAAAFMRVQGIGVDAMRFLVAAAKPVAAAMGIDMPAAARDMAAAMDQPTAKGAEFLERFRASKEQLDRFHAAIGDNSSLTARAVILERINEIVRQQTQVTGTAAARAEQLRAASLAAARATSMGPNDTSMTSVVEQLERAAPATDRYAAAVAALTNQERQAAGPSWIDVHENRLAALELSIKQQARAEGATRDQSRQRELTATIKFWNDILTGEQLNAKQREDVTRRLLRAKEALEDAQFKPARAGNNRAAQEETQAIAAELRARGQLTQEALAERKAELDEEVAAQRMTRAEALAIFAQYLQAQRSLQIAAMADALDQIPEGTRAAQQVADQKLLVEQRLQRELQQLRAQEVREVQQNAQRQTQSYMQSFSSVEGSFKSASTGLLMGTSTWAQATQTVLNSVAGGFIDLGMKVLGNWIATQLAMTMATATQSQVRQAIEMGQSGLGALAGQILSQWMGIETAKTGISAAAEAVRAGEKVAAEGATVAAGAAIRVAEVEGLAAVAAAAAFASTAAIPGVGPALAPEAAAAAYGATMAWAPLAAAAKGVWNLPGDMPMQLHKGEMVVPQRFAEGLRQNTGSVAGGMLSSSGAGAAAPKMEWHIHATDAASFLGQMRTIKRQVAGMVRDVWRSDPSMRPAY